MQWLNKISLESSLNGARHLLQVVGHSRFINELLAHCLEGQPQLQCRRLAGDPTPAAAADTRPETCLIILDATDIDLVGQWDALMAFGHVPARQHLCALFNVDPAAALDGAALRRGVRGLFYHNDAPAAICKGIGKLLEGEVWYRREALYNCIVGGLAGTTPSRRGDAAGVRLTAREQKILRHLSRGASNQDIADQMVVSIHTVKSHLYKIYKKINVPNRFQATLWTAHHLDQA